VIAKESARSQIIWKRAAQKDFRQRPTLPHSFPCSTIGAEELNFRVRDGNGCCLFAIATEKAVVGFNKANAIGAIWNVESVLYIYVSYFVAKPHD
jgi:hypothetical protein